MGVRWRIRTRTFAHVLPVTRDWPPAYARVADVADPVEVLTFHSSGQELDALVASGPPFYKPPWSPTIVGMVLGPGVDWDEVAELLIESYCQLAPKKLAALVTRPPDPAADAPTPA